MRSPLGAVLDLVRPRNATADQPAVPLASSRSATGFRTSWQSGRESTHQLASYGRNGTLFATVSHYAQATAAVSWHLYRQTATDARLEDRPEVKQHLALDLWNKPNRFMTGRFFRELIQTWLDLTGEGGFVITRMGASMPLSLWPVRPDRLAPVPSADSYLAGYMYTSPDGEQIPLPLDDVIVLKYPNPEDPYRGLGPVQALLMDLDSARYSAEWNRNFFVNSAAPGGIVQVEKRLSDDEFNEMVARWREQHQGVANAHRVAVLEQGATWVERQFTQRDMQFVELRKLSGDMIREAFRIHGHMLGQSDDINRANAEAAEYTDARWGVEPRAARWQDMANFEFLPQFGTTGRGVEFDHDSTVPDDKVVEAQTLGQRANAAATLVDTGFDDQEALATCGLPPMKYTKPAAPAGPLPNAPRPAESPMESRSRTWRPRS